MNTNKYSKQQIGERLFFFRTQAGITTEDVATLLSTSPGRYGKLENGESMAREVEELHADEVMTLCEHYGIGIDDFLGTAPQINLNGLSLEDKEIFRDIIEKTLK
jgi:transcriptional regulator with XRE-family HTH domain